MISVEKASANVGSIKFKRVLGLAIDQVAWYLLYLGCLLISYLMLNGSPTVSGDAMYYKLQIDQVITSKAFISFYLIALVIYEVTIPSLTGGKTLSKKILGLCINCKSKNLPRLALRGIIKLAILNPYGVIAYLIHSVTQISNSNIFSNVLIFIFSISAVMVVVGKDGRGLHDIIADTTV